MACFFISGKAIYSHVNISLKLGSRCNSQRVETEPAASELPRAHALPQPRETATGHWAYTLEMLPAFIKSHLIRFIMGWREHVKKAYHNMEAMKSFFEHLYTQRERHFSAKVMSKERELTSLWSQLRRLFRHRLCTCVRGSFISRHSLS